MRSFLILFKNELKLNIRNMNMVIFAIIMPVIVQLIIGMLNGTNPAFEGAGYTFMELSFGALCTISICAGGLMGLPILVAEYRERKILKRFQVTPVSPIKLLTVELTIYILYCFLSMISLFITSKLFWKLSVQGSWLGFLASWILTMISTFSVGMMVGGLAKNSKTASIYASFLYFPMLVFSGTTFPYELMPVGVQKIVRLFPITQGIQLMKAAFLGLPLDNIFLSVVVMGMITLICTGIAVRYFKWE